MIDNKTVSVSDFKTHCLQYLEQARSENKECIIAKRGKPIAKLIPFHNREEPFRYGYMKGTLTILGDIMEPLDVDEWTADEHNICGEDNT